ncbi:MAG TPA: glycosyltransferase [Victivallales bacterium]|nr:glycosyltransferase [Victivallales bacterium]
MHQFFMVTSLTVYIVASIFLMIYGLHLYLMIGLFYRRQKKCRKKINELIKDFYENKDFNELPIVTVQLPVYNEGEIVKRLMRSAVEIDYPKDKFEVQVIDDSTDETATIIDDYIKVLKKETGVDIYAVRRDDRVHFKAGALANALTVCKGQYAAIFDSDFIIPTNFLKRSIAQIHQDANMACIQGRWGHTNRYENWLTRAQSIGIDGHFAAEQGARSYNDLCMNFNGTAGVWRISAIADAGGWSGDTLTEDLDLSYRVQLFGYHISYDFDLVCPAELPNNVVALKSQQKRWAKGSMETAIKLMPAIIKSKNLRWHQKIEAFIHLTHYSVSLLMVILSIFTLPVIVLLPKVDLGFLMPVFWTIIILSALAPCTLYTGSGAIQKKGIFSLSHFPTMLAVGTGLCVNNSLAVLEALMGKKSAFIRTPKSGSSDTVSKKAKYKVNSNMYPAIFEIILGMYCAYTFAIYFSASKYYFFGFFIGAYAVGLIIFGCKTLGQIWLGDTLKRAKKEKEPALV